MAGSTERYSLRTKNYFSAISETGVQAISKLSAFGMPVGRDFNRTWRLAFMTPPEKHRSGCNCPYERVAMSALGQKRTCAMQLAMSAKGQQRTHPPQQTTVSIRSPRWRVQTREEGLHSPLPFLSPRVSRGARS